MDVRAQILRLDPARDAHRIVFLSGYCAFPWDSARALELALFRTFAVPEISGLLAATGKFLHRAQQRYDDTDLLLNELCEHGYDHPRGAAALRRIREIHGRYAIAPEELRYVLSTFVLEPLRWNQRYGWRPLLPQEREATYHFWAEVGRRMEIPDIPPTLDALDAMSLAYERAHVRFAPSNQAVAQAALDLLCARLPARLRTRAWEFLCAAIDPGVLAACGLPEPGPVLRRGVASALRARSRLGQLWPGQRPQLRTTRARPSYPRGYRIGALGDPPASHGA